MGGGGPEFKIRVSGIYENTFPNQIGLKQQEIGKKAPC